MGKYILGLEVGYSSIKLLECKKQGIKFIVKQSAIITLPDQAVSDGRIIDVDKVYKTINKVIKQGRYKAKNMVAVIKSSEIITRDIKMDVMPKKDLEAILELQYQEYLLVDITQYQVRYKIINSVTKDKGNKQDILIVAAPNTMIDPLLELAGKLKMRMQLINIASDAVSKLFSKGNYIMDPMKKTMIVDIGEKSTTVTIVSNGIGVLNKDILFDLDTMGLSMMQEVAFIKPVIENSLISAIHRFLQFYLSRSNKSYIEKIHIIGHGAYLENIDQYMASALEIPCVLGIELNPVQVACNQEFKKESAYFSNILGLVSEFWR